MTIIAAANNIMVADSISFSGGVRLKVAHPKITRAPDGSLVGGAGAAAHTGLLRDWVRAGMDFEKPPRMPTLDKHDEGNSLVFLWLRADGRCFCGNHEFITYEVSTPNSVGIADACWVWHGAYDACHDPEQALRVALARCIYVGGEPQVEHLYPCHTASQYPARADTGQGTLAIPPLIQIRSRST